MKMKISKQERNRLRFMRSGFVTELKPEKSFPRYMKITLFACVACFVVYVIALAVEGL